MATVSQAPSEGVSLQEARPEAPLVRATGQEYVHQKLSTNPPMDAIKAINKFAGIQDASCRPLLGLLDQLGAPRRDTMRAVLEAAKRQLTERMKGLDTEALTKLLSRSFPFIGIPELRDIPLTIISRLHPVPPEFLNQLAKDKDLFSDLPAPVQNQVFEMDKKLLHAYAMPYVSAYTWETGTLIRALDMDEFLPPRTGGVPEEELRLRSARVPRRQQRKMSPALKKLVAMVGGSFSIYQGIADLCTAKYRDSEGVYVGLKESAFCSLRCQLLMALHDTGANELCANEPCHKLAWTLDACYRDHVLDERRLKELSSIIQGLQSTKGKATSSKRGRDWESHAEPSALKSDQPLRVLAEAGMIIRDPSVFHLIIHQVIRKLEELVENESSPSSNSDLGFMTSLLQLAVGARSMLREEEYDFPKPADALISTFYPILSTYILDVLLRGTDGTDEGGSEEIDGSLVSLLQKDEIVRKVTQVFCLERLASGDTITAKTLLANMIAALHRMSERGICEWAAFSATLAQRLARMLAAGLISPNHQLWSLAVDKILIKTVDADIQVHEEVLRLLLAASPQLSTQQMAQYLQNTIENSKRSRRRFKRRHLEISPETGATGYNSGGNGYASAGALAGVMTDGSVMSAPNTTSKKVGDGIKYLYQDFPKQVTGLTEELAPALFHYLSATA